MHIFNNLILLYTCNADVRISEISCTFWILKLVRRFNIRKTITIFVDSILALKAISETRSQTLHIHKNISYAKELNYLIKLHWIPSHQNISGNDLVDNLAKKGHNLAKIHNTPTSYAFIKKEINKSIMNNWTEM